MVKINGKTKSNFRYGIKWTSGIVYFCEVGDFSFGNANIFRNFEKTGHFVHPDKKLPINVQCISAVLLIHIEIFLCKVKVSTVFWVKKNTGLLEIYLAY